jgi:RHS repeat-associated protein
VLVKTVEASPKNVAAYAYDGFYRRTVKKTYTAGGALDKTRDYFYSLGWQALEERLDSGSGPVLNRQFVWGLRHIDDLVLRDRDTGSDGTLDERLYALHDAMHVTAVTNTAGAVQERYGYDGFGKPRFMDASFGARSTSSYDWETLFDAYRFDTETSLYHVRFRYLHPNLGRWLNRDPISYLAGTNLLIYAMNNPPRLRDRLGLDEDLPEGFDDPCVSFYKTIDSLIEQVSACMHGLQPGANWEDLQESLHRIVKQCKEEGCIDCDRTGGGERPEPVVPVTNPAMERQRQRDRLMEQLKRLEEERKRRGRDWTEHIPGTPGQLETAGQVATYVGIGLGLLVGGGWLVGGARGAIGGIGRIVIRPPRLAPAF